MIALTKSLGKELATENIAVNCITPAAAKTRIFEQMSQSHLDWMLSKIPRGRFLQYRGARVARRLAGVRGEFLLDGCGVRHQRGAVDILTERRSVGS